MVEQLARRQYCRLQGLPPDSPPTMEGQECVNMEQPTSADAPIGTSSASETRDDFTIYTNPLVQLALQLMFLCIHCWKAVSIVLLQ